MMGCDLHRRDLEVKELVAKVLGDGVLNYAFPRLLREVVSHLHVNVVRWNGIRAQLWSMISAISFEMSRHQRSVHRSSNHWASLLQASWSVTSTFNSPCFRSEE